jgi:hypothetical protein
VSKAAHGQHREIEAATVVGHESRLVAIDEIGELAQDGLLVVALAADDPQPFRQ